MDLGWVRARLADRSLVGFVNVAWDGGDHAFLLDTKTRPEYQRRGIGTAMVTLAAQRAKNAGCEWLHVDFGSELRPFYLDACGFQSAEAAGIMNLNSLAVTTG
jgi:ribosomal protein S18 acetylase RimI-like enzyme